MAQLSSTNVFGSISVSGTAVINSTLTVTGTTFGPSTTWTVASDSRLKKNITPLSNSLDLILQLKPVNYEWNNKGSGLQQGFIAQDVEAIKPEWVQEILVESESKEPIKALQMKGLDSYLVKAIQELHTEVQTLKQEIKTLRGK